VDNNITTGETVQNSNLNLEVSRNRAILIFSIVSLALLMASIDMTIVSVSLPSILTELKTSLAYVSWIMTGYQLSSTVIMPIVGKLSDDWGRKRIFMIAVAIFTVSSLAAGVAPNIYLLILFRIIQGIGGGAFLPSATGIISDAFGKRRSTAIGLFASVFPIGGIIGPNVGGFIIDHLSWRWIFFVNIPIGILLFILGTIVFPKGNVSPTKRKVDFAGAALFAGAILSILYGLTNWANHPDNPGPLTWILIALGVVLLFFFVRQENRVKQPMIEMDLLRWRPFLAANIYNFVYGAIVFGIFAFIPYYATVGYGMTAVQSGLILTPRSIAMIAMAAITSIYIIRFGYRLPMILGAVIVAISLLLMSRGYHDITILGSNMHNMVLLIIIVTMGGIGMGVANPAANNAVLDLVPQKVAAVTGMRGMFRITGGVFGTAVVVLALSHFQDKAEGLQRIALVFAGLLMLLIPIIFMIPDSARERKNRINSGK
jgi:EmrB/QacA subfamily drug resistance transporter